MLAVLWYHVGLPGLPGGFIGVDIFFVISGFLITGLLVRERERTGRIDLRRFYSRRLRRILPAVLATIAVTVLVAALVLAPLQMPGIAQDGAASALSLGNIRFALESADYFAETDPSPFRHLWSLGVEEQFYLVWPAFLIVMLGVIRSRVTTVLVIGAVTIASFAFGVWLTDSFAPWAFYSLPSRLWELSLGGLLAVGGTWLAKLPGWALAPIGWVGMALVAIGLVTIDAFTPYPGTLAILPTVGAALLIAGTGRREPLTWALSLAPVRFIGRISYSLYLWHWPILVLPVLATGETMPLELRGALGLSSIAVAAVSWRVIEEPFRRGRLLTNRPRVVVGTAVSTAVAVAVLSLGVGDYSLARVAAVDATKAPEIAQVSPSTPGSTPSTDVSASADQSGAAAPSGTTGTTEPAPSSATDPPEPTATPAPPTEPTPDPTTAANPWPLPADVQPALAQARDDKERIIRDGCFMSLKGT